MKLLTIKPKGILRKVILPCMYTIILHCNTNIIKIIGFTKFFLKEGGMSKNSSPNENKQTSRFN